MSVASIAAQETGFSFSTGSKPLNININQFEGPLGLLLYLIKKEEMDIFDIRINEITQQYLEYIRWMKDLDLETAGEFVAMAATLIQIKSRMLLPQYNDQGEVIETEDPRRELVQRLLEYQKFQEASNLLKERQWLGRDVFTRGVNETISFDGEEEIVVGENPLFILISAYRKAAKSVKNKVHQVAARTLSIAERVMQIKDRILVGVKTSFFDLLKNQNETDFVAKKSEVLITFLSLLELGKLGFVKLFQTDLYSDIHIEGQKAIDRDVISSVEEYSSVNSLIAKSFDQVESTEEAISDDEELDIAATDEEIDEADREGNQHGI